MNSASLARSAYARATAIAPAPRDMEYRAFATVTRLLSEQSEPVTGNFARLAEAIHQNQRLWAILAVDVAASGNALPASLRAQIMYLADFTRQHSARILREEGSPAILVEINTALMRGLRRKDGDAA